MSAESYLDDVGGPQMIAVEINNDPAQALWVRVGPVYIPNLDDPVLHGDKIDDKPGIWIEYQARYMDSSLQGPVLLSVDTWIELATAVNERIAKFNKDNYGKSG